MDTKKGNSFTVEVDNQSSSPTTDKEEDMLEQVLYLLDKFCASDELYHELTMVCEDLPKSYLPKHKQNQLNNIPDLFLWNSEESCLSTEPVKVKKSGDGAKMSRVLSFCLFETDEKMTSSRVNTTIAILNC